VSREREREREKRARRTDACVSSFVGIVIMSPIRRPHFRHRTLPLHDCLSLGEVERGLTTTTTTTTTATTTTTVNPSLAASEGGDEPDTSTPARGSGPHPDEIRQRLPLLLRLLQESRPLSSIPDVFAGGDKGPSSADPPPPQRVVEGQDEQTARAADSAETAKGASETKKVFDVNASASASSYSNKGGGDPVVQGSVDRLEDRVAMDPTAEDVERVACRLAPVACRRMLHRTNRLSRGGGRTTTLHAMSDRDVQAMLSGATSTSNLNSTTKRPKLATTASKSPKPSPNEPEEDLEDDDESGLSDAAEDRALAGEPGTEDTKKRRRRHVSSATAASPSRASLIQLARGEDSPEATVARTLEELVRLVRAYSTPPPPNKQPSASANPAAAEDEDGNRTWLDDALDDSLLAQEGRSHRHAGGGGEGSDLPSTIAALLHHAPLIQATDVAEAACRAALPQAAAIVARIAANAPQCVPGLVAGCLRALLLQQHQRPVAAGSAASPPHRRREATKASVQKSLRALAKLSPRESSRIRTTLAAAIDSQDYSRSDRSMLLGLRLELLNLAAKDDADMDDADGNAAAAALEVACLVNEHYSSSHRPSNGNDQHRDHDDDHADAAQQRDENHDDAEEEDARKAEGSGGAGRRQREDGAGASPAESESNQQVFSRDQRGNSMLHGILCENHGVVRETLDVLRNELARQRTRDDERLPTAQFSIVAAAVTWILLSVPLSKLDGKNSSEIGFEALLHELQEWVARIRSLPDHASRETMAGRGLERPFRLLVCASFAGLCAALRIGDQSNRTPGRCGVCCSMLSELLLIVPQSIPNPDLAGFSARFLMRAGRRDVQSLIQASFLRNETTVNRATEPNEIVTRACQRLCSEFTSEQQELICLERPCRAAAPIDLEYGLDLAGDVLLPETKLSDRLRGLLERVLENGAADNHIQNPFTPAFIERSVCALSHQRGQSAVPIIHPVTLERLSIPLSFDRTRSLSVDEKHFILCLFYWFAFRYVAKNDTFSVDFRSLPVVALRHICKNAHRFGLSATLASRLCCWIDHFCPETHQKNAYSYHSHDEANRITKPQLLRILRSSAETPQVDPSGIVAEKAFIVARRCLPESTLVTTTVSAFFSEPNNLPPFFSYATIYRDPLVYVYNTQRGPATTNPEPHFTRSPSTTGRISVCSNVPLTFGSVAVFDESLYRSSSRCCVRTIMSLTTLRRTRNSSSSCATLEIFFSPGR
jgi:hypothetical protein